MSVLRKVKSENAVFVCRILNKRFLFLRLQKERRRSNGSAIIENPPLSESINQVILRENRHDTSNRRSV